MATFAPLTVEQYLNTHYEGVEPEYVRGETIERSMPTVIHGWLQSVLVIRLMTAGFPLIAVRMRLTSDIIRIPDVSLYTALPTQPVPTQPPLAVVEIVSPDDRHTELLRKLSEYHEWGVQHIWVVEPDLRQMHVYDGFSLVSVNEFSLADSPFRITLDELFAGV
jgi:Uma2 family endonuclease